MLNLYNILITIEQLLEYNNYNLGMLQTYYGDIVRKSFESMVDYQQEEVCLENMSYADYSMAMAGNLKSLVARLNGDIKEQKGRIEKLLLQRKTVINKLLAMSVLEPTELQAILKIYPQTNLEKCQNITVFTLNVEGDLELSEELSLNFSPEVIDFIVFYLSFKATDPQVKIDTIYNMYISCQTKDYKSK